MSPITHFLSGWAVANLTELDRRERALVTLAAVAPDADGLGVLVDLLRRNAENPFEYYQRFHHVFGHNLFFALGIAAVAFLLGVRRGATFFLLLISFHLHLLGDIVGARGLGDDLWPVPYFWPFSSQGWVWSGQWPLDGWQNMVITAALLTLTFYWAWKRSYSPLELASQQIDRTFVAALHQRFGSPR
jgi:hypothetical protein